jgi:hypothetical protein
VSVALQASKETIDQLRQDGLAELAEHLWAGDPVPPVPNSILTTLLGGFTSHVVGRSPTAFPLVKAVYCGSLCQKGAHVLCRTS